jgi:hypothetical protein
LHKYFPLFAKNKNKEKKLKNDAAAAGAKTVEEFVFFSFSSCSSFFVLLHEFSVINQELRRCFTFI